MATAAPDTTDHADASLFFFYRGFAATAGEKVFENMQVYAQSNNAKVEEDEIVNANGQRYLL